MRFHVSLEYPLDLLLWSAMLKNFLPLGPPLTHGVAFSTTRATEPLCAVAFAVVNGPES
jgi:hypothetical protein